MSTNTKTNLKDVTFIIPVRVDSLERLENLKCVTTYLLGYFDTNIIVMEADSENNGLLREILPTEVEVIFEKDNNRTFHRTKYLNFLTLQTTTPYIAIWDADVVVYHHQLLSAVESLRAGAYDFIYPYDGRYMETGVTFRRIFLSNHDLKPLEENADRMVAPYTKLACGGGFVAKKEAYVEAGMENENFTGWGPEDAERLRRWQGLEMRVGRVKGYMFHLFHPRGENSTFESAEKRIELKGELNRISAMSKASLVDEIRTWNAKRTSR
ncbi:galactosyltransferase-related protein [Dyadobacter sp. 676]|uniref:Galactosyltransferase-related protein n=1 Tax=Dyadobacter sp. 676 TaxID=3088362 RepID=A0AAU8FJS8_9BACT